MMISGIVVTLSVIAILATLAPLLKKDDWWIRGFDFPRVQITAFSLIMLVALVWAGGDGQSFFYLIGPPLLGCIVYQLTKIFPYTWLSPKQVVKCRQQNANGQISILVANVLTPNRRASDLLSLIRKHSPDLVLTLETDQWWEDQLAPLEQHYQHTVKHPLDNLYGMHLYSRLKLIDPVVEFLVEDDTPSIHTTVEMGNGHRVRLHCLHPAPPSPTENETSAERDAELLLVARQIEGREQTTIVAGDLNDVAWSRTTTLFQEISGLLDPRIGRGFFSTFHAKYPLLRWPLDHVFHSNDFTLVSLQRLPYFGSDHFPIFACLHYQPIARHYQEEPEAAEEDREWAEKKINKVDVDEDKIDI